MVGADDASHSRLDLPSRSGQGVLVLQLRGTCPALHGDPHCALDDPLPAVSAASTTIGLDRKAV